MSRSRADALTGDLFGAIPAARPLAPASMDYRREVKQLVTQLLKDHDESRYVVAGRMSELADVETSKAILDSYTAESREECNLPFWKVPVLEAVTGSRALAEWHVAVLGGRVLWGADAIDADVGRLQRQIAAMEEQLKGLKQFQRGARRG